MPAAVIPHWNRRDLLELLLRNLREQTLPFDEILVVDNGSTDDSVALAERAGARVLQLNRNLGFAAAVNRGIEAVHTQDGRTINLNAMSDEEAKEAADILMTVGSPTRLGSLVK